MMTLKACGKAMLLRASAAQGRAAGLAVKPRIPPASAVRGSRATTDQSIQRGLNVAPSLPRCCAGYRLPLPSLPEDKTGRCLLMARPLALAAGLPPLFNSPESHNMEKTAHSFICQPMKSFPVNDLRMHSAINEANRRNLMELHSYTLCEVFNQA